MKKIGLMFLLLMGLTACGDNFTPREKVATYDPETGELTMPYPCSDWSQSQTMNYKNEPHSNTGCAVNTNMAVQLDNPRDLWRGHGDANPDTGITTKVIEDYRAGKLPVPLTPMQSGSTSSGGATQ